MIRFLPAIYCLVCFCAISCHKNTDEEASIVTCNAGESSKVNGSWELRSWYGGKRVDNNGEAEPGNGNIYRFANEHFEHYENHILLDSGIFSFTRSRGPENADPLDAFLFHNTDTLLFSFAGDTLILAPRAPAYDGIARKYVKVIAQ